MNIITKIRESRTAIYMFLGVTIITFIVSPMYFLPQYLQNRWQYELGKIGSQPINAEQYALKFSEKLGDVHMAIAEQLSAMKPQDRQRFAINKAMLYHYAHQATWDELVRENLPDPLYEQIGLGQLHDDEIKDLLIGEHPSPILGLRPEFRRRDKKKFVFDKGLVFRAFTQARDTKDKVVLRRWLQFIEQPVAQFRKWEKLLNMVARGHHPSLANKTKKLFAAGKIEYLVVRNDIIAQMPTTEEEVTRHYTDHPYHYPSPEWFRVSYVVFPVQASDKDRKEARSELTLKLKELSKISDPQEQQQKALHYSDNREEVVVSFTEKDEDLPGKIRRRLQQGKLRPNDFFPPIISADGNEYIGYIYLRTKRSLKRKLQTTYEFLKVTKKITPSSSTKEGIAEQAKVFAQRVANKKQWDEQAEQEKSILKKGEEVVTKEQILDQLGTGSALQKTFQEVYKEGTLSRLPVVFLHTEKEDKESYWVAMVTSHEKEGITQFDHLHPAVKDKVKWEVKQQKKQAELQENLSWDSLIKRYKIHPYKFEDLRPEHNTLPKAGLCPKAIGVALALQPGETSGLIPCEHGLVMIRKLSHTPPAKEPEKKSKQKKKKGPTIRQYELLINLLKKVYPYQDLRHQHKLPHA